MILVIMSTSGRALAYIGTWTVKLDGQEGDRDFTCARERASSFFSETSTSQHHNVVHHTHTQTLTNTLTFTHTHMTGQQWLVGQVVPGFFSGFCKLGVFGPKVVSRTFFDCQGSRNIQK